MTNQCPYCIKTDFKNKISFSAHTRQCTENPQRKPNALGHSGGNHFTTGSATGHTESAKQKIRDANLGRKHSQATKDKISEIRIAYLTENPDKVPYLLNHSSKISYPEKYFRSVFENEEGVQFEYRVSRYSLDVAFPDIKLNIEIDGEQHYVDATVIMSDLRRNTFLSELGWTTVRIRWSEYVKRSFSDREIYVNQLKELLKYNFLVIPRE